MVTNTKIKFSFRHKKSLLIISLLLVILLTSLFVYKLTINITGKVPSKDIAYDEKGSLDGAVYVGSEMELRTTINNAPSYTPVIITLGRDVLLTGSALEIPKDKDIMLASDRVDGFWKLIGADNTDTILVNGKLTLADVVVTHEAGVSGRGVFVNFGGTLTMSGGAVCNNIGGGICNCGSFTMYGGVISNNTVGGGVFNNGYDFTMYGGEISCNKAENCGGGVDNYNGKVRLYNGTICGNTAKVGGGVDIYYGSFYMSGGVISGNVAEDKGGGVYNYYTFSHFVLSGGEISNNTANIGGGVCSDDDFTMSGGVISGNIAGYGGGVYVGNGVFNVTGGNVSGNTSHFGDEVWSTHSGHASEIPIT